MTGTPAKAMDAAHAVIDAINDTDEDAEIIIARAIMAERETIADKAREFAAHYPPFSDGRNTFILLAEWIEARQ